MGTAYKIKVVVPRELDETQRAAIQTLIESELASIDAKMSTYREDSELSRFNASRTLSPFAVSAETAEVLRAAHEVSQLTQGAFDVTVSPLVQAWGFGAGGNLTAPQPSEALLKAAHAKVGFAKLLIDSNLNQIQKLEPELSCDLSGIAPGFAVDRIAQGLLARGYRDFLIDVGGELRASGQNGQRQVWRIGIERPDLGGLQPGPVQRIVPLDGLSLATSGDYRQFHEVGGERFSHIIDPRAGRPIRHQLTSVSVVHPQCMMADAWATALMVLGPDDGFALAVEQKLAVYLLIRQGDRLLEKSTPAFTQLHIPG